MAVFSVKAIKVIFLKIQAPLFRVCLKPDSLSNKMFIFIMQIVLVQEYQSISYYFCTRINIKSCVDSELL